MDQIRPNNLLKSLCAIEFRAPASADTCELVGTINFNDPLVRSDGTTVQFGVYRCVLSVQLNGGLMPLRHQLSQKQLSTGPVGDVLRKVDESKDEETSSGASAGFSGGKPKIDAHFSGKLNEGRKVSGASHLPEYLVHVNICGDASAPAWRFTSVDPERPIVGTIPEETFGRIEVTAESATAVIELSVPHGDDFKLKIEGIPQRRASALERVLLKEIEFLNSKAGPLCRQDVAIGA